MSTPEVKTAVLSPANMEVHVVGVTHYVDAVRAAEGGPAVFVLVPEPTNPYDSNAIAVYVNGRQIGHVPSAMSGLYGPVLKHFADQGIQLQWNGETGGWEEGVYARFDSPTEKELKKLIAK
jgi:hypothetical protein